MNRDRLVVFIFSLLILCGCATGGKKHPSAKKISREPKSEYSAKILRPAFLKKDGASLVVVPFTAGIGVEADSDLDRLSLMIVKRIIDALNKDGKHFKILPAEEADKADFIIQGHITHPENLERHRVWMFSAKEVSLSIEARMAERKTGNLILIYSRELSAPLTKEKRADELSLAQQMGQDIAEYLLGLL